MTLRYLDTRNRGLLSGKSALIRSAPQAPSRSLVTEWNGCEKIVFRVWPFVLRLLDGFFTTASLRTLERLAGSLRILLREN